MHILEECKYLEKHSKGLKFDEFLEDETLKKSVCQEFRDNRRNGEERTSRDQRETSGG